MDNTSRECSVPSIALYPCNNVTGSWAFLNMKLKQQICRSQWVKMVTTDEIIKQMNAYDGIEGQDAAIAPVEQELQEALAPQEADAVNTAQGAEAVGSLEGVVKAQNGDDCPELEPQNKEEESNDEAEERMKMIRRQQYAGVKGLELEWKNPSNMQLQL